MFPLSISHHETCIALRTHKPTWYHGMMFEWDTTFNPQESYFHCIFFFFLHDTSYMIGQLIFFFMIHFDILCHQIGPKNIIKLQTIISPFSVCPSTPNKTAVDQIRQNLTALLYMISFLYCVVFKRSHNLNGVIGDIFFHAI